MTNFTVYQVTDEIPNLLSSKPQSRSFSLDSVFFVVEVMSTLMEKRKEAQD